MKPNLDEIEARCNAATSFLARLDMEFSFSKDIPALLAYCRELEEEIEDMGYEAKEREMRADR